MNRSFAYLPLLALGLAALASSACDGTETCEAGLCGSGGGGGDTGTTASGDPTSSGSSTQSGNPTAGGGDPGSTSGGGDGGGSGSSGGGGGGSPTSSTSTGKEQTCVPGDLEDDEGIGDQCGIFVSADVGIADAQDGTQRAPYRTLTQARDISRERGGGRIYVCAASEALDESVEFDFDVEVYGKLGCTLWSVDNTLTRWTAATNEIPLRITGEETTVVFDGFAITAQDATTPGGSSIGVLIVDALSATIANGEVNAGAGADGVDAEQPAAFPSAAANGAQGATGCLGSVDPLNGGAPGVNNACGTETSGGRGGAGTPDSAGGDASDGRPLGVGGVGGAGEDALPCANGLPGATGTNGSPGAGAGSSADGSLVAAGLVFLPASGGSGAGAGTFGSGGGGGGGANLCTTGGGGAGPSGGGGGAGGCGGAIAPGGGGGGASISIVVIGASTHFSGLVIQPGSGGTGGSGAIGQNGQVGGQGNIAGGPEACNGAGGGTGGQGGSSGGGRGGHSIGIAWTGIEPTDLVETAILPGDAGAGGLGSDGVGANDGTPGAMGESEPALEIGG